MKEKQIHLNALDLDVSIPENVYFHDDGFVEDIEVHRSFLCWKYTGKFIVKRNEEKGERLGGTFLDAHQGGYSERNYFFHIFYIKYPERFQDINTKAHEETHFLHSIRKLNFLRQHIQKSTGIDLDFDSIKGPLKDLDARREIIAELGGLCGVHLAVGWDNLEKFYSDYAPRYLHLNDAYRIYSAAREESLKLSAESKKPRRVFYL